MKGKPVSSPKLTVIMPVRNCAQFVAEAVESVIRQTFEDFQFIIVDDASQDETVSIIRSFNDPRIDFIANDSNIGRAACDNIAISRALGKYIAKMDGDDICLPHRFENQIKFLDANLHIDVVGSWMQHFGAGSFLSKYPTDPESARCSTLFSLPVGNPSLMLRSTLFKELNLSYDGDLRQTEDFDFFARNIKCMNVCSLPDALLLYRTYPTGLRNTVLSERQVISNQVRERLLSAWGIPHDRREAELHHALAHSDVSKINVLDPCEFADWMNKLVAHNSRNPWFAEPALRRTLSEKWFHLCYMNPRPYLANYRAFQKSSFAQPFAGGTKLKAKFILKELIETLNGRRHY
jgi:glycosyltransferase involved in cell wall biosynthesis